MSKAAEDQPRGRAALRRGRNKGGEDTETDATERGFDIDAGRHAVYLSTVVCF